MAYSFVNPSLLPSIVLALFLSFSLSFCSAREVQISDICSKHKNPTNCAIILNSIPGLALGADIDSLSLYLINVAHVNGFDTITLMNEVIRNITDPKLKQSYSSCDMDYQDVLVSLTSAKESYTSKDFNNMKSNVANVVKDVQDCETKAPSDAPSLIKKNEDLEDVSLIIMILADFLAGKYIVV